MLNGDKKCASSFLGNRSVSALLVLNKLPEAASMSYITDGTLLDRYIPKNRGLELLQGKWLLLNFQKRRW
jgi:hypothetical protein